MPKPALMSLRAVAQNVGHHLVGAGRLGELKALLALPGWLERKLHSYGTASVVADFRRHLMVRCRLRSRVRGSWQRTAAYQTLDGSRAVLLSVDRAG